MVLPGLVCIALLIGGNQKAQDGFYRYMTEDDAENRLLETVHLMLRRTFERTKKYLTEKNAKLEMIVKQRKQAALKRRERERADASI